VISLFLINHPLPQVVLTNFRPKEKVGENPPDNDDAPIRNWDYTESREARQTAGTERGFSLPLGTPKAFASSSPGQRPG